LHRPDRSPNPRPRAGASHKQSSNAFQDGVAPTENLRKMQIGRPSNGTVDCVLKLVNAERLKAVNILAAADAALKELG
jgi:hypothetical protein